MDNKTNVTKGVDMKSENYEVDGKLLGVKDLGIPLDQKARYTWWDKNWQVVLLSVGAFLALCA